MHRLRLSLAVVVAVFVLLPSAGFSKVSAQELVDAQNSCDLQTLADWAWGDSARIEQLSVELPPDCFLMLIENYSYETTEDVVAPEAGFGVTLAGGNWTHTHSVDYWNVGVKEYSIIVEKGWGGDGSSTVWLNYMSHWANINVQQWTIDGSNVTHNFNIYPSIHKTNVTYYMTRDYWIPELETHRSTQNTLCVGANGWWPYNFDCS